jgi:hypothetical protein
MKNIKIGQTLVVAATEILWTQKSKDGDTEVRVAKIRDGFSVSLWDLDANAAVPYVKIFPTFERAKQNAVELIKKA